jgi:hypothetical protein
VILAIDTLKVTICEENVTDPLIPGNNRFFPPVDKNGRDAERSICLTIAKFSREPVSIAVTRANPACLQFLQRSQDGFKIQELILFKNIHQIKLSGQN